MTIALLVFAAQFAYITLLGLQQLNVAGRHYVGAFMVSLGLGVFSYGLTATIATAVRGGEWFGPVWFGYMAGGPLGIVFSIWLHPRLRKFFIKDNQ